MGWLVPGGGGQPEGGVRGLRLLSFPKPPGNQGPSIIQHQAAGNGGVGGEKEEEKGGAGQGPVPLGGGGEQGGQLSWAGGWGHGCISAQAVTWSSCIEQGGSLPLRAGASREAAPS